MSRSRITGLRNSKFRPRFESLEDRLALSATISTIGPAMFIRGDAASNTVDIADDGAGGIMASITSPDGTVSANVTGIKSITVEARGGADALNYKLTNALTTNRALQFNLGYGADRARLDLSAGITAANLLVHVAGSDGEDDVGALVGDLNNANLLMRMHLGEGADTARIRLTGNLLGNSNAGIAVDGNQGADRLGVDATGVNIGANAVLGVYLDGDRGEDSLGFAFEGGVRGKLLADLKGGEASDTIVANLTIKPGSTGRVGALVQGGEGDDNLTLNVFDNSGGEAGGSLLAALRAWIITGPGNDIVTHTDNVHVKA